MPPEPVRLDRRRFLTLATLSTVALAAGCGQPGAGRAGQGNGGRMGWTTPMRIPPLQVGEVGADGVRRFSLTAAEGTSELVRGRTTRSWGFDGPYLGPTLRANRGEQVAVGVRNELPETTTVHWHGMRLPAVMDGTPHQPIEPGDTWEPTWTIEQPAATLWYHPHPHGDTAAHVYRGLAGLWIVDDPDVDDGLPHEYGVDDVPLVIQDRDIGDDGTLREDRSIAFWGLMGNEILVNGTHDPYLDVTTRVVRLRVLNGSNARVYHLHLSDGRPLHVVANDCGQLPAPVAVDEVTLSPAERAELLVELDPGATVVLRSRSRGHGIDEGDFDIVQLRAAASLADRWPIPAELPAPPSVRLPATPTRRRFVLAGDARINSRSMDMSRIDEVVPLGAIEEWEVWAPGVPHNFHIHDAAFTVLDVDGRPPPAHLAGLKDTVFLPSGATARLAVEFGRHADPTTPYMYHCHILRHEDEGMMGQFTVVEPGTEDAAPRRIDVDDHGH